MSPTSQKSEPVRTAPKPKGSAVKTRSGLPEVQPGEKTSRYWIGTTPDCPVQNVTVAGVCFPRFRGNPVFDGPNGEPDRELDYGIRIDLTEDQVEKIVKHVEVRSVRWVGTGEGRFTEGRFSEVPDAKPVKRRRGIIVVIGGKGYRRNASDQPLGKFLYMHRLDQMSAEDLSRFPPETMEVEE